MSQQSGDRVTVQRVRTSRSLPLNPGSLLIRLVTARTWLAWLLTGRPGRVASAAAIPNGQCPLMAVLAPRRPARWRPPPVSTGSGGFAPIAVACWSFSSSQKPTSRRSRHIASRCGGGERISGFGRCPPLAALSIGPNKPNPGYATVASEHRRRPFAVEVRAPHGFVAQVRKLRRTGVTDLGRSVPCENAPANANANAARASEAPGA